MKKGPLALVILDGFGLRTEKKYNAIAQAKTPHLDAWFKKYPHTQLKASGTAVGLLKGYIGNSEVGHLTMGIGRVIKQPITLINEAINNGSFFTNPLLVKSLNLLATSGKTLHILGLLSDAGVHAHIKHMLAFIDAAVAQKIDTIMIHPILDGRDTPPQSAATYLQQLADYIHDLPNVHIGSIQGRFYAMDRDHNWDRTQQAVNVLLHVQKKQFDTWSELLEYWYAQGVTDEFIPPSQLKSFKPIHKNDGIIFTNYRPDRARQLTQRLLSEVQLAFFITPVAYSHKLKTTVLFPQKDIKDTLKEILSNHGYTIFSCAETEKYAHVTYFFGGGREKPFKGEVQQLIPSLPAQNYAQYPEMSAKEITQAVLHSLNTDPKEFYLINYANADMVGHSGNMQATIKAVECLDKQLGKLYKAFVQDHGGILIITADHGNAEDMFDEKSQQPRTAHTTNPVPFIVINSKTPDLSHLKGLSDIAPFILQYIDLEASKKMSEHK